MNLSRYIKLALIPILFVLFTACGLLNLSAPGTEEQEVYLPDGMSHGMWVVNGDDVSFTFFPGDKANVTGHPATYRQLTDDGVVVIIVSETPEALFFEFDHRGTDSGAFRGIDFWGGEEPTLHLKYPYSSPVTLSLPQNSGHEDKTESCTLE